MRCLKTAPSKGPIDKFLSPEQRIELKEKLNLKTDDTLFFICDTPKHVNDFAGQIRTELANRLDLIDKDSFELCYITDFPMFEKRRKRKSGVYT